MRRDRDEKKNHWKISSVIQIVLCVCVSIFFHYLIFWCSSDENLLLNELHVLSFIQLFFLFAFSGSSVILNSSRIHPSLKCQNGLHLILTKFLFFLLFFFITGRSDEWGENWPRMIVILKQKSNGSLNRIREEEREEKPVRYSGCLCVYRCNKTNLFMNYSEWLKFRCTSKSQCCWFILLFFRIFLFFFAFHPAINMDIKHAYYIPSRQMERSNFYTYWMLSVYTTLAHTKLDKFAEVVLLSLFRSPFP